MSWTLIEERGERDRAWDEVARSCGYATFFQTREWAELFAMTLRTWEPDPVVMEFSDGTVLVFPLMRRLDSEHRQSTVPGMYGGPLVGSDPKEEHWEEFDRVPRWYEDIVVFDNPFSRYRWDPNGLIKWRFHTHVASLSDGYERLSQTFRRNARRNIKSAEESGIEIRLAHGTADARAYFEVYEDAVGRFGERLESFYPLALFENLVAMPSYGDAVRLSLASIDGEVVSGLVTLHWGETVAAWHASTRPASLSAHPYPLLLAAAMRRACDDGFRWFDLLYSGSLSGVAAFKEGFATTLRPYNGYWSPGLTPDSTRPDTGTGAAAARIRERQEQRSERA